MSLIDLSSMRLPASARNASPAKLRGGNLRRPAHARASTKAIPAGTTSPLSSSFAAIDFETADYGRDSACAIGIVRVEGNVVVERAHHFIRPPRRDFVFTYLHGISWDDVASAPDFRELWPSLASILSGLDFIAAHNASFDRAVLKACCNRAGLEPPNHPFHCTVRLARAAWNIYPTRLNDVCQCLRIPLRHHHAASDAEACAKIVIAAAEAGIPSSPLGRQRRSKKNA